MPVRGRGAQSPACGIARHQSAQRPSHRLVAKAQAHQGLACGMHGPDEIQQRCLATVMEVSERKLRTRLRISRPLMLLGLNGGDKLYH